jgi:hypothetical protein
VSRALTCENVAVTHAIEQGEAIVLRDPGSSDRRSVLVAATVLVWITAVLLVDADGSLTVQRLLGLGTWLVLGAILVGESPLVRMQTAVVVVFATAIEYTCSPLLEVYLYRFDNVPAYVPPGHGLVYLAALAIGRTSLVREHIRAFTVAALTGVGVYAAYGLLLAERTDVLGAFWFLCLAGFFRWGPSPGLYVGAAFVVTYLEVTGTALGTWVWQYDDPTGLVPIGNPPSGAAGGYGWFDLAALLSAPWLLDRWRQLTGADQSSRSESASGSASEPSDRESTSVS